MIEKKPSEENKQLIYAARVNSLRSDGSFAVYFNFAAVRRPNDREDI